MATRFGLSTFLGTSALAIWGGWLYSYDAFSLREMAVNFKAKKRARELTTRLDRIKQTIEEETHENLQRKDFKSEDDYLKMLQSADLKSHHAFMDVLEREADGMKKELYERELGVSDLMIYRREIAALRETFEKTRLAKENKMTYA